MRGYSILVAALTSVMVSSIALASQINSQCYMKAKGASKIEGVRIDKRYKIASVSKVLTAHWAIMTLGPNYRFTTKVHATPVSEGLYDIHLAGDYHPYFDLQMLHLLVSELNKNKITKVRNLTYDEKFIYAPNLRFPPALVSGNDQITQVEVMRNLRADISRITTNYSITTARARALHQMKLSGSPKISVKDISFLAKEDFESNSKTKVYPLASVPLYKIVKEFNRNSNNYASDLVFTRLGGPAAYEAFMKKRMKYTTAQVRFVNGSGYPIFKGGEKLYNEATCGAVIRTIIDLRTGLKKADLDLQDVMSVAGMNAPGETSVVTNIYANANTNGALIAKTGTVADTIALAGLLAAEEGDIYFGAIYDINSKGERFQSYTGIRNFLETLSKKYGGKGSVNYKAVAFLPFDDYSTFIKTANKDAKEEVADDEDDASGEQQGMPIDPTIIQEVNLEESSDPAAILDGALTPGPAAVAPAAPSPTVPVQTQIPVTIGFDEFGQPISTPPAKFEKAKPEKKEVKPAFSPYGNNELYGGP